jgi:hypothetical protein
MHVITYMAFINHKNELYEILLIRGIQDMKKIRLKK